jgi:hypothetical protein
VQEPIFARTRYTYTSYTDFWRLVELSGFRTCYVDEIDLERDEIYITSPVNGETRPHLFDRRAKLRGPQEARVIVWQLERPCDPSRPGSPEEQVRAGAREILTFSDAAWISDRWVARVSEGGFVHVTMGSHPELAGGPSFATPQYDLAHMSCSVPRRDAVVGYLHRRGLRIAPNGWGLERDRALRASRAILNVHQDGAPVMEPLRIALAAAYRLPYLSEVSNDPYPLVPDRTVLEAPVDRLGQAVEGWLRESRLRDLGSLLHEDLCVQMNFRKGVMEALERTFMPQEEIR